MDSASKRIVLASASPRRKEIMSDMGLNFEVVPADVDESSVSASTPRQLTKKLSVLKACAVKVPDAIVIAADTVVVYRGKVYGKPLIEEKAKQMLSELEGRWHTVYTGVTVIVGDKRYTFSERSRVRFKRLDMGAIDAYVSTCKPLDKAGAYGIQDKQVVEKYRGSYTNIVGLPAEKLAKLLRRVGAFNGND